MRALVEYHRAGYPILYAIQDQDTKLYWIYSYVNKDFAQRMRDRVQPGGPNDRAVNWRADTFHLTPSTRTDFT